MDLQIKEEQKSDGNIRIRYKARLVALGFSQIEGLEFYETFVKIVKFTSIRTLLEIVNVNDLHLHQMDEITAFINGELNEEVYMEHPEVNEEVDPLIIECMLNEARYGLKKAPRKW